MNLLPIDTYYKRILGITRCSKLISKPLKRLQCEYYIINAGINPGVNKNNYGYFNCFNSLKVKKSISNNGLRIAFPAKVGPSN